MKKFVFFCVLEVFYGSNTHYLMGDTHFFFFQKILQSIYPNPWKNKWAFQVKKWGYDPKCVFRGTILLHWCILGQMPIFWWVTPIFYPPGSFFLLYYTNLIQKGTLWVVKWAFVHKLGIFKSWNFYKKLIFTYRTMKFLVVASQVFWYCEKKIQKNPLIILAFSSFLAF